MILFKSYVLREIGYHFDTCIASNNVLLSFFVFVHIKYSNVKKVLENPILLFALAKTEKFIFFFAIPFRKILFQTITKAV